MKRKASCYTSSESSAHLARIITGLPLAHTLEDMVEAQDVTHLVDHGVPVAHSSKVSWI